VSAFRFLCVFAVLVWVLPSGCGTPHGQPGRDSETLAPNEISDFGTLYAQNCAGCHGAEGRGGAAIALANPVYLAIADEAAIRKVIANGVPGTAMPAFAQTSGGMLTEKQITVISTELRARWAEREILGGTSPPSYTAKSKGDFERGASAYKTYCQSCHGPGGRSGHQASAITDDSFLALVSDQGLRTIVITGRPELGAPDWRGDVAGKPMSEQEVTDVVAWLAAQRVKNPGQPYSVSNYSQQQEPDDDKRK
jgi:mono/diheme cytochrome c family protein